MCLPRPAPLFKKKSNSKREKRIIATLSVEENKSIQIVEISCQFSNVQNLDLMNYLFTNKVSPFCKIFRRKDVLSSLESQK